MTCCNVPQSHGSISSARKKAGRIGGECDGSHGAVVAPERLQAAQLLLRCARHVPHANAGVGAEGERLT